MENKIQKSALLTLAVGIVAIAAAAPKRPFSHKYHMTQVASCENCHPQAPDSVKAEDNLLPDKMACVMCHDEVDIMNPRVLPVQKFDHAIHVKMGKVGEVIATAIKGKQYLGSSPPAPEQLDSKFPCAGCHHGIPESENVPHDKAVKGHFPHMADCLVCHSQISPPESCKKCHAETALKLRPGSHTAEFVEKHSEKSMPKTDCATCHGKKITCGECH